MKEIAEKFGKYLDHDEFELTKGLLSPDCKYSIGKEIFIGPDTICNSYEQNMIEGRNKLDNLVWGESRIEAIGNSEYFVHFTDYLTHKGIDYTHICKQKLTIHDNKIIQIEHVEDFDEQKRLNEFYKKVGLK